MHPLAQRIVGLLVAARMPLLIVAIAAAAVALIPARKLRFDRSIENMFAPDDPVLKPYRRLKRTFGGNQIVMAVYADDRLFSADGSGIRRLGEVSKRLEAVPGVRGVLSLDKPLGPAIVEQNDHLAARLRKLFEGYTHDATGKIATVVCLLAPQSETKVRRRVTIDRLREMTMAFYEKIFARVRGRVGAFVLSMFAGRRIVESLRESLPKLEHAGKLIEQGKDCLFYQAPAVMMVHAESWDTCSSFNCAAALYNCSLLAHTLGVGCCFNGYLVSAINNDRRIKKWLGIPHDDRCFGAMTLGYQEVTFQRLVERDPAKVTWR